MIAYSIVSTDNWGFLLPEIERIVEADVDLSANFFLPTLSDGSFVPVKREREIL